MNPLDLLDSPVCLRLALALAHFLWQGVVITLFAVVMVSVLGRKSSRVRYGIYMGSLVVMALTVGRTYCVIEPEPATTLSSILTTDESPSPTNVPNLPPTGSAEPASTNTLTAPEPVLPAFRFNEYKVISHFDWQRWAPCGVALYLLGFLLMTLRLVLGLCGGKRLRKQSTPVEDIHLLTALQRQAQALGLKIQPALLYCAKVTVPTVVGVIRPAILLPLSLASGFTLEQVEMLLCHELAHIRRWDPFWNVVQRTIEALLFFHPAMWFISRRIRLERENCCDDLVLQSGGSPLTYAASLLDAAQRSLSPSTVVMLASVGLEATGGNSQIRSRVLRLVGKKEEVRLRRPSLILLPLVLAVLFVVISSLGKDNFGIIDVTVRDEKARTVLVEKYNPQVGRYVPQSNPSTLAGGNGHFHSDHFGPGKYRLWTCTAFELLVQDGNRSRAVSPTYGVRVEVQPGETTEVKIGGGGRRVIGRLLPQANSEGKTFVPLSLLLRDFISEEKAEDGLSASILVMEIREDGTFEIPDVMPGDYRTQLAAFDSKYIPAMRFVSSTPNHFTIPSATNGREDEPFNLGDIEVELMDDPASTGFSREFSDYESFRKRTIIYDYTIPGAWPLPLPSELSPDTFYSGSFMFRVADPFSIKPQTGSVEGYVMIGKQPAANVLVTTFSGYPPSEPTRPDGYFRIDGLFPGKYRIKRMVNLTVHDYDGVKTMVDGTHGVPVEIRAGETEEITIGGKGRRIVGRLLFEGNTDGRQVDYQSISQRDLILEQDDNNGFEPYRLLMDIHDDGTFEIPDVESGTYKILLSCNFRYGESGQYSRRIVTAPRFFYIPDAIPGHEDGPFDVGVVKLRLGGSLGLPPFLQFCMVAEEGDNGEIDDFPLVEENGRDISTLPLLKYILFTESNIQSADVQSASDDTHSVIHIILNTDSIEQLSVFSLSVKELKLAVIINGEILAVSTIKSIIKSGGLFIRSNVNPIEARKLVAMLNYLPNHEPTSRPFPTPTKSDGRRTGQSTGSVHGRLMIGKEPQPNAKIYIKRYYPNEEQDTLDWPHTLITDSEGYFQTDHIAPGKYGFTRYAEYKVKGGITSGSMYRKGVTIASGVRVEVRQGETTEVKMGGEGRCITGRLVSESNAPGEIVSPLSLSPRYFILLEDRSDGFMGHTLVMNIREDGTFEMSDVTPGEYTTRFEMNNPLNILPYRYVDASPSSFVIPPPDPGHEDEPYDVGTINVRLVKEPPGIDKSE